MKKAISSILLSTSLFSVISILQYDALVGGYYRKWQDGVVVRIIRNRPFNKTVRDANLKGALRTCNAVVATGKYDVEGSIPVRNEGGYYPMYLRRNAACENFGISLIR